MNQTPNLTSINLGPYESKRVRLRLLTENDIGEHYLSWLNDSEVTKYLETVNFSTSIEELKSYCSTVTASERDVMFAVIDKSKERHIGNIKLGNIDWYHKFADLGVMIGNRQYWGKGYGREACELLLHCAFESLKLNKVILGVHGKQKGGEHLYQKIGFEHEGCYKKLLLLDGQYYDKIIMGISRDKYLQR